MLSVAKTPVPENALTHYSQLEIGMEVFHVYGIYPVQNITKHIIRSLPVRFEEHPEYDPIHESHKDYIVFDSEYISDNSSWCFTSKDYANSWNIGNTSYNSNYMFATLEDAERAHAMITKFYEENDDARNSEIERIAEIRSWDRDYDYDDFYDYDNTPYYGDDE